MPPIATRISSHCRVVNRSTVFLLPLKEYFPINPLSLNNTVANSKQHASTPLIFRPESSIRMPSTSEVAATSTRSMVFRPCDKLFV